MVWVLALDLLAQRATQRQRPFTVEGHGVSTLAVAEAAAITKAVWALAIERLGVDERTARGAAFTLSIYRDRTDYEAAGERTGLSLHKTSPAFASSRHDAAYCHVLDTSPLGGLGPLTRGLVAHEAFHVVVYKVIERGVFLPSWYVEGLSLWCEGEMAERMGWCAAKARTAGEVDYVRRAQALLEADAWPSAESILHEPLGQLGALQRYAVYRMVALWQLDDRARFDALWEVARTHGGFPSAEKAMADALRLATAERDLDAVDRELRAWVAARSCAVDRALAQSRGGAEGDRGGAVQWMGGMEAARWGVSARVVVPEGAGNRADVVLGARPDGAALRVSVHPGLGVRVLGRGPAVDGRHDDWGVVDEWRDELGRTACGEPIELELAVRKGRLDVKIQGRRVLRVESDVWASHGRDGLEGVWGLGGIAPGAPEWQRIRFP